MSSIEQHMMRLPDRNKKMIGTVFHIQKFSVHDGPGIRTVVFLKGCPLRCRWCANPESQNRHIELAWTKGKCIACKECLQYSLQCNPTFQKEGLFWDKGKPLEYEKIKEICPTGAFHSIGRIMDTEEVLTKVEEDAVFYGEDGGLTISGGEPLMQAEFTYALLKGAREEGISTAIETTGYGNIADFQKIASQLDFLIIDLKMMDEKKHLAWTGVSNQQILRNFKKIRKEFPELPILVRTPVIPGVNDTEEEIAHIHQFLSSYSKLHYELLKYHVLGKSKYESLHRNYEMGDAVLDEEKYESLKKYER